MHTTQHLSDDLLNSWADGTVIGDERSIISTHLDHCEDCQEALSSLILVRRLLSDLPEPVLPRSFQLTPDKAKRPTPIRPAPQAPNVVRLLPLVRTLSIVAVLTVLILGAASAFGPVTSAITGDGQTISQGAGTEQDAGASENVNLGTSASSPGEVVDQGEAATVGDSAMESLGRGTQPDDTSTAGSASDTGGASVLQTATRSAGVAAVVLVAIWIVLHQLGRPRPAP